MTTKICKKCNQEFNQSQIINGKKHNLQNRDFCLICSPFKQHNTKDISKKERVEKLSNHCALCKKEKSNDEFYSRSSKNRHTYCKDCHNKYTRERLRFYKTQCKEYKGGKCQKCGYDKCLDALDFHHLGIEKKDFNISHSCKNFESKKKELDKCILLCANCHREYHAGLFNL